MKGCRWLIECETEVGTEYDCTHPDKQNTTCDHCEFGGDKQSTKVITHFARYECPHCHHKTTHKGRAFDDESLANHIRQCRRNPDWLARFGKEG